MTRLLLIAALTAGLTTSSTTAYASGSASGSATGTAAAPSDDAIARAKALYDEGRKAYRRGDVELALERFNEAYDLTELPVILYNIGLTYTRIYQTSNDLEHLRRAEVVLENFKIQLAADPSLGEFETLEDEIDEIRKQIEAAEQEAEANAKPGDGDAEPTDGSAEAGTEPTPTTGGSDRGFLGGPGRTLKLAGIGSLAGGGALAIGGVVGALIMQKNYFDEVALLDRAEADRDDAGCPGAGAGCEEWDLLVQQRVDRANAFRGNIGLLAGTLGGAGVAAIGAGVALLVVGGKKDRRGGAASRVQVAPTLGGIVVVGRF